MKKIILSLFFLFNHQLLSSTLTTLKLTDEDFIMIQQSPKKDLILERINDLIILKKSLKKTDDIIKKLNKINILFNQYKFKTDKKTYNKVDYWATRKEFIFNGSGDCEDFVIAKYFTLIEVGIDESKLSLLHNIHNNAYHLVLAYQENQFSEVLILDNINKNILPLTSRNDILVLHTLKTINLNNEIDLTTGIQGLSNYKWTKIYLKSKNQRLKLIN